ncbi:U3 small nucleolar RNA-associated protein 25-like [Rana temporaria]|uniref:U3 small nucleolar RNA-associated protein 25-like n=1 Tax=Rana temporaria TaxID=8407 RepID=UPI001AACFF2C|nr:U3 small nucleolar RNA-associated protein 25-like [Rana temporaria]
MVKKVMEFNGWGHISGEGVAPSGPPRAHPQNGQRRRRGGRQEKATDRQRGTGRGRPGGSNAAARSARRDDRRDAGSNPGFAPEGREPRQNTSVPAVASSSASAASHLQSSPVVRERGGGEDGRVSEAPRKATRKSVHGSRARSESESSSGPAAPRPESPGGLSSGEEGRHGDRSEGELSEEEVVPRTEVAAREPSRTAGGIASRQPGAGQGLVWIMGHSFVRRGAARADMRPNGRQLGVPRQEAMVRWLGFPGMLWSRVVPEVHKFARLDRPPDVLLIHAGGNDLGVRSMLDVASSLIS